MSRDDWTPWTLYLDGAGYQIHERRGQGRRQGWTQMRVWSGGAARVLAAGKTEAFALLHLAVGLARHANLRGVEAGDPSGSGALDPIGGPS